MKLHITGSEGRSEGRGDHVPHCRGLGLFCCVTADSPMLLLLFFVTAFGLLFYRGCIKPDD